MVFSQNLKIVHGKLLSLCDFFWGSIIDLEELDQILNHFVVSVKLVKAFADDVSLSLQKGEVLDCEVDT